MKTTLRLTAAAFGLAIFTLSTATVRAEDYTYGTHNGTITITGYSSGPSGVILRVKTLKSAICSSGLSRP